MEKNLEKNLEKIRQQYERIGVLSIEDVLPHILAGMQTLQPLKKEKTNINGFLVNTKSIRLQTFAHTGTECLCCGLQAQYFAVERTKGNDNAGYHLNLWGKNSEGEEILFTHDHIVARSLGGKDALSNTETWCGPCNWQKGALEQKIHLFPLQKHLFLEEIVNLKKQRNNTIKKLKV